MGNSMSNLMQSDIQSGGTYSMSAAPIDFIVCNYILSMNIESLEEVNQTGKCDALLSLTVEAININLSHNDIRNKYIQIMEKDYQEDKEITNSEMCKQVALYYINIAKVYSSIIMSINPEYIYEDINGKLKKKNILTKIEIPTGSNFKVSNISFCGSRINHMKGIPDSNQICIAEMNTLDDYFGIPELTDLFFDSGYDEKTKEFIEMSPKSKKQFDKYLNLFYKVYSGKDTMPEHIKKFEDIPINDYKQSSMCIHDKELQSLYIQSKSDNSFTTNENLKEQLISKFAAHIQTMVYKVNKKKLMLIEIINQLFTYDYPDIINEQGDSPNKREKLPRINPTLTMNLLNDLLSKSGILVAELFISCELDYKIGDHIYSAIVELQTLDSYTNQIQSLEEMHETLLHS
jgi:hypothetical protein